MPAVPSVPEPVPVTVLTGFLGSGKTTLLNGLLRQPGLSDTAVLINEFGEVGLDHLLVERLDERTVLLADPMLAARFRLQGVVTTVDAVHGARQLSVQFESVKQAAVADLLVITKPDLAAPEVLARLERKLGRLNPGAARVHAVAGDLDAAVVLGLGLYDPASRGADVRRWLRDESLRPAPVDGPGDDEPGRSRHGDAIRSFVLNFDAPLSREGLDEAFGMLTGVAGDALLRVKGVVDVEDDGPCAIHAVQHQVYPTVRLGRWPTHWDGGGETPGSRRSRIVFIVRQPLSREYVSSAFEHFARAPLAQD